MISPQILLLILAIVFFVAGFLGRPLTPPLQWGWLGAFFVALWLILGGGK